MTEAAGIPEIAEAGLFDGRDYLSQALQSDAARLEPLRHFISAGAAVGLRLNPFFDPAWYRPHTGGRRDCAHSPISSLTPTQVSCFRARRPSPGFSAACPPPRPC
ncbi:MAG TPA: hypothetical protein VFA03_06420 [Acetobacteraceae bacterium]|nr:hypothetical protein [Acetobacteraceae bacterium]